MVSSRGFGVSTAFEVQLRELGTFLSALMRATSGKANLAAIGFRSYIFYGLLNQSMKNLQLLHSISSMVLVYVQLDFQEIFLRRGSVIRRLSKLYGWTQRQVAKTHFSKSQLAKTQLGIWQLPILQKYRRQLSLGGGFPL